MIRVALAFFLLSTPATAAPEAWRLDASAARAGFVFATQAMRGPQVLDTARHPAITI